MSKKRSENIRFLEPYCHSASLSIGNPTNIRTNVILCKLHLYAFIFVADCVNVCVYLHSFFCGGLESRMRGVKQPVLLSTIWDSRTRTMTRSQASRTRTRTRTWKLVRADPRGQRPVAVLGKIFGGAWPLIIWEATTAKRNYYRSN